MRLLHRSLCFAAAISLTDARAERPQVVVSVDPEVSRNGETVKVRYILTYMGRETVTPPKMPALSDWEVTQHFPSENPMDILYNGQITRKQVFDTTFFLKPLRAGRLRIPALDFYVESTRYQTPEKYVEIERLPGGVQSRPRAPVAQRKPYNPLNPDEEVPPAPSAPSRGAPPPSQRAHNQPAPRGQDTLTDTQTRESFFIRAEATKTSVFVGEMIQISYAMYERSPVVSDPEVSKFPDFKGFLKENLVVPKIFARTPWELAGQSFLRSELIRYAVFPLKAGDLRIEPMALRATFAMSLEERASRLFLGQPIDPRELGGIRTQKFTAPVDVAVKPLPPAPADAAFTGGVGQFRMSAVWPSENLRVDNPFNVTITIKGSGNLGSLGEPNLGLPDHVEVQPARGAYKFQESGEGYKTFEYVLLPKRPGPLEIKELKWTYFDPQKATYENVVVPGFALNVEGGVPSGKAPEVAAAPPLAPLVARAQTFVAVTSIGARHPLVGRIGWAVHTLLYAALALLFARRRRDTSEEDFFRRNPWERTAKRFREEKKVSAKLGALLTDQWIRERLAGALGREDLNGESSRDELLDAVRARLHPEHHNLIDPIRRLLSDLDILRFTGGKTENPTPPGKSFEKAQSLVQALVRTLPPPPEPEEDEDDE